MKFNFDSARPHTAVPPDERVGSPHKPTQSPLSTREPIGATPDQSEATDSRNEILDLIYHPSDFQITQIVDNSKVCVCVCVRARVHVCVSHIIDSPKSNYPLLLKMMCICIFPLHCCTLYFRKDCLHVHF